jgi:Trk-type K+ transport system membrane component
MEFTYRRKHVLFYRVSIKHFSIWHLIIWSWLPTIGMIVFVLLTVRNVSRGKRRVLLQNIQDQRQQNRKKIDAQLIKMMVMQSFVLGSTTTSYSIVNLCIALGAKSTDDALKKALGNYLSNVFGYIALTGPCMSFYLFTLSSQLFRRELINLFHWRPRAPDHQNAIALSRRN